MPFFCNPTHLGGARRAANHVNAWTQLAHAPVAGRRRCVPPHVRPVACRLCALEGFQSTAAWRHVPRVHRGDDKVCPTDPLLDRLRQLGELVPGRARCYGDDPAATLMPARRRLWRWEGRAGRAPGVLVPCRGVSSSTGVRERVCQAKVFGNAKLNASGAGASLGWRVPGGTAVCVRAREVVVGSHGISRQSSPLGPVSPHATTTTHTKDHQCPFDSMQQWPDTAAVKRGVHTGVCVCGGGSLTAA